MIRCPHFIFIKEWLEEKCLQADKIKTLFSGGFWNTHLFLSLNYVQKQKLQVGKNDIPPMIETFSQ